MTKSKVVRLSTIQVTPKLVDFSFWIVGDTPLICHAWSEKARKAMLDKQRKIVKTGKEVRNPQEEYINSLYPVDEKSAGAYGFPAMAIKNAICSSAHKDKGIPRVILKGALWIRAEIHRVRPALAGAICDMPLLRVWGSPPEMREDMVVISGTATPRYRGQFTIWAMNVEGRLNTSVVTPEQLTACVMESGMSSGLGEWRNGTNGMFGAYHLASADEEDKWIKFSQGKGKLPLPEAYSVAAE